MLAVPLSQLGVGPEVSNNMMAPHNCVGGSEMNCLPGAAEAATMFADPSKMQNMDGVPAPSHWSVSVTSTLLGTRAS